MFYLRKSVEKPEEREEWKILRKTGDDSNYTVHQQGAYENTFPAFSVCQTPPKVRSDQHAYEFDSVKRMFWD